MSTEVNLRDSNVTAKSVEIINDVTAPSFSGSALNISSIPSIANQFFCSTPLVDNSTINNFTTPTQINVFPADNTAFTIRRGNFTCSSSGVVVPDTGIYLCLLNVKISSSAARSGPGVSITVNGTVLDEIGASGYMRSASGHQDSSLHIDTLLNLVNGDEVGLAFSIQGATGTVNLDGENSSFALYRVS